MKKRERRGHDATLSRTRTKGRSYFSSSVRPTHNSASVKVENLHPTLIDGYAARLPPLYSISYSMLESVQSLLRLQGVSFPVRALRTRVCHMSVIDCPKHEEIMHHPSAAKLYVEPTRSISVRDLEQVTE